MSNLLKIRKIITLGKTQSEIAWVIIFVSDSLAIYPGMERLFELKRYIHIPTIKGNAIPEMIPVTCLSYFSARVIF
jgi:hypothetical protein